MNQPVISVRSEDIWRNVSHETAISTIRQELLSEIDMFIWVDGLKQKCKKLTDDTIIDNYIQYLKRLWDPRYEYISSILSENIDDDVVDNELGHLIWLSERFQKLITAKKKWENVDHLFDHLDFDTVDALIWAVNKYNVKNATWMLKQFQRPILESILMTSVWVNVTLMIGDNLESTEEITQTFYNMISTWNLSGDSIVSLCVILPFLWEGILKIRSQWFQNYFKYNKLDSLLNIAGIWEMWIMWAELAWVMNNSVAFGSLLRSLRILRIFRITQKSEIFNDIIESVSESAPNLMKIAFTFWWFSLLSTLFFMEVYGEHIEEFSNLTHSFDSMTQLFFNDDAVTLNDTMRSASSVHPITNEISIWWSRTYQFISNIFMIWIPPAIVYDVLAKNTTTKRYLAAIWEKMQDIWNTLKDISTSLQQLNSDTNEKLEALKLVIDKTKIDNKQD